MKFQIRPITTRAELNACVELQRATWGSSFSDLVPASLLKVSQRVGGVTAGAFSADGTLIGFVYGLTGLENGKPVHWSDMLAVRPEARNLGVGRELKEYQRRVVESLGVDVIYWTYDPLVARNAHLNFNVFGVRVVEYVEDMYGDTDSDLHRGIGTDRFIVAWDIGSKARTTPHVPARTHGAERRIEIPLDVHELQVSDPAAAVGWRRKTRSEIQSALFEGFVVTGFQVDDKAARGYYLLSQDR